MGDVGTGKTVVALFRDAAGGGKRLPGRSHGADGAARPSSNAATLTRLLEPLELRPELLLGRQSVSEKAAVRARALRTVAARLVGRDPTR
jgi:RecG-like helicase